MRKISALAVGIATISLGLSACSGTGNEGSSPATVTTTVSSSDATSPNASATASSSTASSASGSSAPASDASSATVDLAHHSFSVTAQDAMKQAVDVAGGGFVHSLKIKHDNRFNAWLWEVKVLDGTTQHKVKINADSGEVVKHEQEQTNDTEKEINLDSPLSFEDAKAKALDKRAGRITEWKYEWDDSHYEYQFEIDVDGSEEEVTVNADTGAVTED